MKLSFLPIVALAILTAAASSRPARATDDASGALAVERLRCEYRTEPLGVDRPRPELSWIVTSDQRAQVQSAYRVLVASSPQKLAADQGDLWDSGKVAGDATFGVVYSGRALKSHEPCHWKVMAWDGEDRAGPWSKPALWTVGIFDPAEWQGEWIGYDGNRAGNATPPRAELDGASWIGHAADAPDAAPAGARIYLAEWKLPAGTKLAAAELIVTGDDSCDVNINGNQIAQVNRGWRRPRVEQAGAYLHAGTNTFRVRVHNDAPGPTGLCLRIHGTTVDGTPIEFVSDDAWRSAVPTDQDWRSTPFASGEPVRVLAPYGQGAWGELTVDAHLTAAPSYLRSDFTINKPVKRATVYLAALGWADLSINGTPINRDYFSSGWTDYRRRVYYRAYEVAPLLQQGDNAWGAVLADGWYSGHIGWDANRDLYGKNPRVRAMLRVEYEDGSTEAFSTQKDGWTAHMGPTKVADILIGEEYDATRELAGWDEPGFAHDKSAAVDAGAEVEPKIQWHPGPPVVKVGEFPAQSIAEPTPGVYVFDLGQNFAGVARLKIRGRRGQVVQLRFAERLNPDGTLYTTNLRYARVIDRYTCRGDGEEIWQPRQTFHGFQYVELTGVEEKPALDAVTGVALSSDTPLASEFECSDPKLNRLYQNVLWTQRANFIDVPTDCPQRDERLGWTGDAQVYAHTATMVCDVQAFFRKWLVDLADAQRDDGQFPKVAPVVLGLDDGGPAWADAGVICPWEMYLAYGDKTLLAQQYPSMVRFVEFTRNRSRDGVLPPDNFHCFGDWLSINADTPREVIYTAYHARCADIVSQAAKVLGNEEDARKYAELTEQIKAAFRREYVAADGTIRGDTQCGYVLAIVGDLVAGPQRQKAERLVANIESRGDKLSTGFIGTKDLMLALAEVGRNDVALKLLHQQDFPGWMFSINQGATSIWERWDGWTPERGFQDVGMNSFAHYSFGAVYGWMAENLGGIRGQTFAYGHVVIVPVFDPELDECRVTYDGPRGKIETQWRRIDDSIELRCRIPANSSATLLLRGVNADEVQNQEIQSGESSLEVVALPTRRIQAMVGLKSGEYRIKFPDPQ